MHLIQPRMHERRAFLRRAARLAVAGAAAPFGMSLAAMGEAAAFDATDYKALVCVFLYGGNDHANTVVNFDEPSYAAYRSIRQAGPSPSGLAIDRTALAQTVLTPTAPLPGGRQFALHPAMPEMAGLFNSGRAAVLLNVGPLIKPITRAQYESGDRIRYPLPPQLMSHNDQQSVWQSSAAEGSTIGWGGNIGDLALSSNQESLFTCISVTGNAVFLSGDNAIQYQLSSEGAIEIECAKRGLLRQPGFATAEIRELVAESRTHVLENEYNKITRRALEAEVRVSEALRPLQLTTRFPTDRSGSLSAQLSMVARLIGARSAFGSRRQVFLVSLGGFDLHDNLIELHPGLLRQVSQSISAFYAATVELGVADKVTTFTASDFGRTLTSNGNGTDHGWGGHHFVIGGAVRGKAFYGVAPPVSVGNTTSPEDQWHIGQGRLIPSSSVDQFGATLAKWFGVQDSELAGILPNIRNFGGVAGRPDYPLDLGFLA